MLKKRQEIIGNVSEIEREALKASDGDISNMPIHMADAGTDGKRKETAEKNRRCSGASRAENFKKPAKSIYFIARNCAKHNTLFGESQMAID